MFIPLYEDNIHTAENSILIFTEGTIIGPGRIWDLLNFNRYVPIGFCVQKITRWYDEKWNISYLTSRRSLREVNFIKEILKKYKFPGNRLYYRGKGESYKDIAEEVIPDILIEDNCRSIGGKWQMTITYVEDNIKNKIKSIVVNEFKGIDHLPESAGDLLC